MGGIIRIIDDLFVEQLEELAKECSKRIDAINDERQKTKPQKFCYNCSKCVIVNRNYNPYSEGIWLCSYGKELNNLNQSLLPDAKMYFDSHCFGQHYEENKRDGE